MVLGQWAFLPIKYVENVFHDLQNVSLICKDVEIWHKKSILVLLEPEKDIFYTSLFFEANKFQTTII